MQRLSNLVFLSLTTVAAFFLLVQLLTFLNGTVSHEIDMYWLRKGELGEKIAAMEKTKPLPSRLLYAAFSLGLEERKGGLRHLLRIVEENGPGNPTAPEPLIGGLFTRPGAPGRTEAYNGWVDALTVAWRRGFDSPDTTDKAAYKERLGKLFAAAGLEAGKFEALKITAADKPAEWRRKVMAFRVLAEGLPEKGGRNDDKLEGE